MYNNIVLDSLGNSILEGCNDLIFVLDLNCNIIAINIVARNMLNVPSNKAIGQNLFALCRNNRVELSFTEKELSYLKSLKDKSTKGYIIYPIEQKKDIVWKYTFVNNQEKRDGCFLIIGKDVSELEKYKKSSSFVLACFNSILENLPEYIYWKDLNLIYQGCNKHVANYLNLPSPESIVGKTDRDFGWSEERVHGLNEIDKEIIATGIPVSTEDLIPKPDGTERVMISSKSPLIDTGGSTIGIIGISVDVTDYKRAERLTLENKAHLEVMDEQKKFKQIVDQVVHDIRSPLASLLMILKPCEGEISEQARIALREAAIGIGDIANNLLCRYESDDDKISTEKECQPIMVALVLLQILSEKKISI